MMFVLLAVILSIDAFGIGVSYKVRKIAMPLNSKLIICVFAIAATYAAAVLGTYLSSVLPKDSGTFIGSAMLALTGLWIIKTATGTGQPKKSIHKIINIGSITITVVRNPESCDFDKSRRLDACEAVYMGAALSIDSFCSGFASGFLNVPPFLFSVLTGIFEMAFLYLGELTGTALVKSKVVSDKTCVVLSGVLLIAMAAVKVMGIFAK